MNVVLSRKTCKRRGCGQRIPQVAVNLSPSDGLCSLTCLHKSIGGNPWKQDDDYVDPTFTRNQLYEAPE